MPPGSDSTAAMTTAIYARFSSDLQTEKSIDDQVNRCQEIALREGAGLCEVFTDEALSGASMANRPGLQRMLAAIASGRVSMIITESLDRLSRDQADLALIHREIKLRDIRLITASDGEIQDGAQGIFQIGMRGIFGAMYLADLADKTRRGQKGVARDGRIPGGLCYGYRVIPGEKRGLREIEPDEAAIIRRIFNEYLLGKSPKAIAKSLNAEGVPGPRGKPWGPSTIFGNVKRLNGILCNPLYGGEHVFNRQRKVKDPTTGRSRMVPKPESEWMRQPMEHLRIVDRETWDRVHTKRVGMASVNPGYHRRAPRPLSGLVKCGVCGGSYASIGAKQRYGCTDRHNRGTCDNNRTILASELERRVLGGLKDNLLSPEAVEYAVEVYRHRRAQLEHEQTRSRITVEKEIGKCEKSIALATQFVRDGETPPDWLFTAATEAEKKLKVLRAELKEMDSPTVHTLHPKAPARYRKYVEELNAALTDESDMPHHERAIEAVRSLISRVIVSPGNQRGQVFIDIEGDLAALLGIQEGGEVMGTMGAGAGFARSHNIVPLMVQGLPR